MSAARRGERSAFVENVFKWCMDRDMRTLEQVRAELRMALAQRLYPWHLPVPEAVHGWSPTDHELQIMVGRLASRGDPWEFYPAYTTPPRYVSRARVLQLRDRAAWLSDAESREYREQLEDLKRGVKHWKAQHARAKEMEAEVSALVEDAEVGALIPHVSGPGGQLACL